METCRHHECVCALAAEYGHMNRIHDVISVHVTDVPVPCRMTELTKATLPPPADNECPPLEKENPGVGTDAGGV